MPNIIYILTNEAMPGLVKIGDTVDLKQRMRDLGAPSGVPLHFECHYAAEVPDHQKVEKLIHQLFSEHRVNPKREFFRIPPEKALLALQIGGYQEVQVGVDAAEDAVEKAAVEKAKERRKRIRLSAIGIHPGAVLTFSRDESMTAVDRAVTWSTANRIIFYGPDKAAVSFSATTGIATGSYTDTARRVSVKFGGALLQKQGLLTGRYGAGNVSGRFWMQGR
jgi:hypothetical protein